MVEQLAWYCTPCRIAFTTKDVQDHFCPKCGLPMGKMTPLTEEEVKALGLSPTDPCSSRIEKA